VGHKDATAGVGDPGDRQGISFGRKIPANSEIADATQAVTGGNVNIFVPTGQFKRPRLGPRYIIETRYTRDARVPISADDPDMDCGWRSIPIAPTIDDGWEIFDSSKDHKTGWHRRHWVEGSA
jgi:hypothetical protein